jgi:hypothetical protein
LHEYIFATRYILDFLYIYIYMCGWWMIYHYRLKVCSLSMYPLWNFTRIWNNKKHLETKGCKDLHLKKKFACISMIGVFLTSSNITWIFRPDMMASPKKIKAIFFFRSEHYISSKFLIRNSYSGSNFCLGLPIFIGPN